MCWAVHNSQAASNNGAIAVKKFNVLNHLKISILLSFVLKTLAGHMRAKWENLRGGTRENMRARTLEPNRLPGSDITSEKQRRNSPNLVGCLFTQSANIYENKPCTRPPAKAQERSNWANVCCSTPLRSAKRKKGDRSLGHQANATFGNQEDFHWTLLILTPGKIWRLSKSSEVMARRHNGHRWKSLAFICSLSKKKKIQGSSLFS